MTEPTSSLYTAELDIIRFCAEKGFRVRAHPFFRDVEKFWPFVVAELPDAAVIGPHPTPICQNQAFFDSLSNFGPKQRERMAPYLSGERTAIAVDRALLIGGNPSIGHFIDIHLLVTLYLTLFDDFADLPVITMGGMPRGSYDLLAAMGVPGSRLLKIDATNAVVCKTLYVPTVVGGTSPDRQTYSVPAKLCRLLRDRMVDTMLDPAEVSAEPFRKIYIQRNNVQTKRVGNAAEVDAAMLDMGFELVDPATVPLREQVRLAQETKFFVTPCGSQVHMADFAQAGASVLLLATLPAMYNPSWDGMDRFDHLGVTFRAALHECDDDGTIQIDLAALRDVVQTMCYPG